MQHEPVEGRERQKPTGTPDRGAAPNGGGGAAATPPVSPPRYNFGPAACGVAGATPLHPAGPGAATPTLGRTALDGPGRVAAAAVASGALWALLVDRQAWGIGWTLWTAGTVAALLLVARRGGAPVRWRNVLPCAAGTLFFAAMVAVRAGDLLTLLNVSGTLVSGALLLRFLCAGELLAVGGGEAITTPARVAGHAVWGAAPVARDLAAALPDRSEARTKALPVLRGLLLAAPVLAVLVPLLVSADAVFARTLENGLNWLLPADLPDRLLRIATTLAVAWGVCGAMARALTRRDEDARSGPDVPAPWPAGRLGYTEGMTVLGSVLLVFIAFIAIQCAYLFGGARHVLSVPGLTYAEYARRGFGELVCVAVLTTGLLLALRASLARSGARQETAFRAAGTLLVGLTLVLLASAATRMAAYEAAYGATETRLYVDVFLFWLGAALVALAALLCVPPPPGRRAAPTFAFAALVCAGGFVGTLDALNPDARVVEINRRRAAASPAPAGGAWAETLAYRGQSDDAIPDLLRAYDMAPPGPARIALGFHLRGRLNALKARRRRGEGWPSWNAARARAYAALSARAAETPSASCTEDIPCE